MLPLLRSEIFRLRRRWMAMILLLVVVLGVAAVYIILWLVYVNASLVDQADQADDLRVAAVPDVGMDIANFLASIVSVIIAASIIGTEFGWGTIRALLPRARSRVAVSVFSTQIGLRISTIWRSSTWSTGMLPMTGLA